METWAWGVQQEPHSWAVLQPAAPCHTACAPAASALWLHVTQSAAPPGACCVGTAHGRQMQLVLAAAAALPPPAAAVCLAQGFVSTVDACHCLAEQNCGPRQIGRGAFEPRTSAFGEVAASWLQGLPLTPMGLLSQQGAQVWRQVDVQVDHHPAGTIAQVCVGTGVQQHD